MQERPKDPLVGSLIDGRYLVQSRLARGGMSTVYLATDGRLDRDVALKVLYPHLAEDRSFLDRFEREAKSAARLSHPHVVGVLDQGLEDSAERSIAYLVMEYVPGRTLRDLLHEKGRLSPRLALAMIDPVAEGLGAAHEAGLVHRDVKPENVLLGRNGRIKIADFGLARAVSTSTNTGTLVGTVAYLAPELVTGGVADARSDIYSAGIMLFELLTGHQPFTGDVPIQVAFQHANSTVPPPSTLLPGLAADIDELVQWCTSADPEERPVDGNALLGELRHIRTTLTDAELDFESPEEKPDDPQRRTGATELIRTLPDDGDTTVIDSGERHNPTEVFKGYPTTVISSNRHDTQVLPSAATTGSMATEESTTAAGSTATAGSTAVAGSMPARQLDAKAREKMARRDFKTYQKEQARAAQRPEKSLRPGNERRRNAVVIVLMLVLAALAAGLGWFFGVGPGALVSVPDVTDLPAVRAQAVLSSEGLDSPPPVEEFDEVVDEGLIIRTEPVAQSEIRRFQEIQLFVSKGPELFAVPNVIQQDEAAAVEALGERELEVGGISREFSESIEEGLVISQSPTVNEQVRRGTPVNLVISRGPEPINVPVVVGETSDDAVEAIEDAGLTAEVNPDGMNSAEVPEGSVLSQTPDSGQLNRGDTVELTMSLGPQLIEVPNVFSSREAEAVAELEAAGFTVEVDYTFGTSVLGLVAAQDLTGEQPEGSTVTITVT